MYLFKMNNVSDRILKTIKLSLSKRIEEMASSSYPAQAIRVNRFSQVDFVLFVCGLEKMHTSHSCLAKAIPSEVICVDPSWTEIRVSFRKLICFNSFLSLM